MDIVTAAKGWLNTVARATLRREYPRIDVAISKEPPVSFLSRFKTEFEKLFHSAPTWVHVGQNLISFGAPVVLAIVAQFDPSAATAATSIVRELQTDFATASVLIGDGTVTPTLTNALANIQANLSALLTAGHVKDAKVQADVTLVLSEIQAFVKDLPSAITSPTPPTSLPPQPPPATA